MPLISVRHRGSFQKTLDFFAKAKSSDISDILDKYGEQGVAALSAATPVGSGETAESWFYEIEKNGRTVSICWGNSNENQGVNIAVILDRGHGNGHGYWIQGRNYIAPAILPVMEQIAHDVWKEVAGNE